MSRSASTACDGESGGTLRALDAVVSTTPPAGMFEERPAGNERHHRPVASDRHAEKGKGQVGTGEANSIARPSRRHRHSFERKPRADGDRAVFRTS